MRYAIEDPLEGYGLLGRGIMGSAIDASMSVLAGSSRPLISLAVGSPAPDAIPTASLAALTAEILGEPGASGALASAGRTLEAA